jgi:cyclophilin family peptidyl-prolyl cis-trans isomerase
VHHRLGHGDDAGIPSPLVSTQATRNFVQLALEGYYDGTTFHRIIPGFMIQVPPATTATEAAPL